MSDHRIVVAFAIVAALGCSRKDEGKAGAGAEAKAGGQSLREALEIICYAGEDPALASVNPAEKQQQIARTIAEKVRNRDAIDLFAAVVEAHPSQGAKMLDEAARRAGLAACPLTAPVDGFPGVTLPEVGDVRLDPLAERHATLTATPTEIVVEGNPVTPVRDGRIEGDRLASVLAALAASPGGGGLLTVVVDAGTPYALFIELLSAARPAYRSFQIVVRHASGVGGIPINLPDRNLPGLDDPTGVVVSMTRDHLVIWSTSGREGTLKAPALSVTTADLPAAVAAMQQKLADVAARHPADRHLMVMADGALPMASVARVMAAARRSRDGAPLFELVLSTGFE